MVKMDFLNEINAKYIELEAEADRKLEKAKYEEEKLMRMESKASDQQTSAQQNSKQLSYEEARLRNANLLKAVDMAKARLRSRSTFSPIEPILEKAIQNYKMEVLSLEKPASHQNKTQLYTLEQAHSDGVNIYETLQ